MKEFEDENNPEEIFRETTSDQIDGMAIRFHRKIIQYPGIPAGILDEELEEHFATNKAKEKP